MVKPPPPHNRFTALFPAPPWWAGARRELLDFMVQGEINRGRHTDHPAGRHSIRTNQCPHIFTGRMPFLPPNQQCQSTEGKEMVRHNQWNSITDKLRVESLTPTFASCVCRRACASERCSHCDTVIDSRVCSAGRQWHTAGGPHTPSSVQPRQSAVNQHQATPTHHLSPTTNCYSAGNIPTLRLANRHSCWLQQTIRR